MVGALGDVEVKFVELRRERVGVHRLFRQLQRLLELPLLNKTLRLGKLHLRAHLGESRAQTALLLLKEEANARLMELPTNALIVRVERQSLTIQRERDIERPALCRLGRLHLEVLGLHLLLQIRHALCHWRAPFRFCYVSLLCHTRAHYARGGVAAAPGERRTENRTRGKRATNEVRAKHPSLQASKLPIRHFTVRPCGPLSVPILCVRKRSAASHNGFRPKDRPKVVSSADERRHSVVHGRYNPEIPRRCVPNHTRP